MTRLVPADIRPVVRGGLAVAALVAVVAPPAASGAGNPSSTPLGCPCNLAFVLLVVAAATVVLAVRRRRRVRSAAEGG